MKQNSTYVLRKIENNTYLLPFGQSIADHRHGIQINETSAYLWILLEKERSLDDLITLCAEHFQTDETELPLLRKDIQQFVESLLAQGFLIDTKLQPDMSLPHYKNIQIAGMTCCLYGPKEAFPIQLTSFVCPVFDDADLRIEITCSPTQATENGTLLIRNPQLWVIERPEQYTLLFPTFKQLKEVRLSKDGSLAKFYCSLDFTEEFQNNLFHAIRLVFLYLAQKKNMAALHSASILYHGKAWLFSGPSGTGKSTHTNLWKEILNTPLINGDLNLIGFENGKPVIHGIPWCGTSGIFDTKTHPLGGIILLAQAPTNYIEQLSPENRRNFISNRLISPVWTQTQLDSNLQFVKELSDKIMICRLHCTPDKLAVDTIQQEIDQYLSI